MKKSIFILAIFTSIVSFAQSISNQVVSSNGGSYKNSNINVSWTVGEVATESYSNSSVTLTQGFHQSIIVKKDTTDPGGISLDATIAIDVFPNPATSSVTLSIDDISKKYHFILVDSKGSVVRNDKILSSSTILDMQSYSNGMYFLKILNENKQEVRSFKIEKIN